MVERRTCRMSNDRTGRSTVRFRSFMGLTGSGVDTPAVLTSCAAHAGGIAVPSENVRDADH